MSEFGNYDSMYGSLDYRDAVVLDIGADYGSTARFFFERGAKRVIVSERNHDWHAQLQAYAEEELRLIVVDLLREDNAVAMFMLLRPDVVKVDCEGCERILLTLSDELLSGPRAWVMETHSRELYDGFKAKFEALGYQVQTVEDWPETPKRCIKVITAQRS